ncbi:MAG: protease modulator HflC [Proteobacteria bacterium]|nr:protease modulator HflC [Pseudomonadota bacterium]
MKKVILIVIVIITGILIVGGLFTVKETETAIKFQLGRITQSGYEPGLHFKTPFINNVRKFDKRILTLDMPPEQMNTSEQKYVDVDYFVKWRIIDVEKYYLATKGNESVARSRLAQSLRDELRAAFSSRTLQQVVSEERAEIMEHLTITAGDKMEDLGMQIIDVRIKQIELMDSVVHSVFERMETQRKEVANKHRSQGREQEEIIRSEADRNRKVLLAEAQRDADKVRGEGDAKSAEIYASAYNRDQEFYAFYRSLAAYEKSFSGNGDTMVLSPDSDYFEYFKAPKGK